jgi:NhaP-type Na+/H+ or K+/H+ antiporter
MNYLKVAAVFALAFVLNLAAPDVLQHIAHLESTEAAIASTLWCSGVFLVFGWLCSKAAEGTLFPSFTLQLLVGIVLHDALAPLSAQLVLAVVVCTALAAIILKSGGDEIERREFLQIAFPTLMIATVGYLVTFFIMFAVLMWLGVGSKTAALLSAIIGSTDPAALIPTLKTLMFKPEYKQVSNLSVAESALNDAVGAIFTGAIATMILGNVNIDSVSALAAGLFSGDNIRLLAAQFGFGVLAGVVGWLAMYAFERYKFKSNKAGKLDMPYDFALVLAVPLVTFMLAQLIHGNGFLAAFIAGLLANFNHGTHHFHGLLHNLEVKMESVAKPTIFMMVGPFVALQQLADTAWLGLCVSLAFMLLARPVAVFVSLLPTRMRRKEKIFMCAVRETGVIPVVLAVVTVAQFPDMTQLMPLTAWVVIWTLTVLPALTPWWAKQLNMIEPTYEAQNHRRQPHL